MNSSRNENRDTATLGAPTAPPVPILNAPRVVVVLALVIVVSHAAYLVLPNDMKAWVSWHGAVSPQRFLSGPLNPLGLFDRAAPLVTHMFLHANWMHVFFNTIWLLAFGSPVARRLSYAQGSARASVMFVLFFTACGIAGALAYIALHASELTLLIGASGGVSGLLGGLVRFAFQSPGSPPGGFAGFLDRRVVVWTVAFVATNLLLGAFGGLLTGESSNIAWEAHVAGYFCGLIVFPAFARIRRTG